jgi:serine/threonine protein phosphatase 1
MTQPIYAIGDIHGQLDWLHSAIEKIIKDGGPEAKVVFLGDYIDRGPDSRGVIDYLIAQKKAHPNWVFLKGNHDRFLEWYVETPQRNDPHLLVGLSWLHPRLGGNETLKSYGVDVNDERRQGVVHAETIDLVPEHHISFLKSLDLSHHAGDLFFAHAGIRPDVPLADQTEEDLLWIRQEFHRHRDPHPALIVHGHTPVKQAMHCGNRINLDTGAGYGRALTTAVFEDGQVWTLEHSGRQALSVGAD